MQRLAMDLSPPAILTLRAESYFALTTNSVQLGSRVEMGADLGVADISGHFAFDALVIFSPHFTFMIDLGIGLDRPRARRDAVRACTSSSTSRARRRGAPRARRGRDPVGPVPDRRGPVHLGRRATTRRRTPADPRQLAHDALHHNPGAWQALMPPDADRVVRLKAAPPSEVEVTVHPMGLFDVRQHAIPLETVIARVGRQSGARGPAPRALRRAAGQRRRRPGR